MIEMLRVAIAFGLMVLVSGLAAIFIVWLAKKVL